MEKVISTANTMVHGAMVISPTLGSLLAPWIKVSGSFSTRRSINHTYWYDYILSSYVIYEKII